MKATILKDNFKIRTKNTINRHVAEQDRLISLYKRGAVTKAQAVSDFKNYLELSFGKKLKR